MRPSNRVWLFLAVCCVVFATFVFGLSLCNAETPVRDLCDLPVYNEVTIPTLSPWRRGAEKRDEQAAEQSKQIKSGVDQGVQAIVDGQNAILAEIKAMREEKAKEPVAIPVPDSPVVSTPVVVPESKPTIVEKIKDRIETRKDMIGDFIDGLIESGFARRILVVALIVTGIWFSIKKHRKEGTPTHIERGVEFVKNATANIPILGQATAFADTVVDKTGDRIRALQEKLDERHAKQEAKTDKLQEQLTQVALATPAPSQATPEVKLV